jgi:hypothetical protein
VRRSEQLHQLLLHFAAVNNAPASVTSNPDSLALWVQELSCRAYSLAVVANSLKGWTLQPAGASTLQVLQQLLRPAKTKAAAASQADAAVAAAGQHKKELKSKQGSQQAQQQQAGTLKASGAGSKRLSSGQTAGAAAGTLATHSKKQKRSSAHAAHAADEAAGQPTPAAQQQPHSVKKQKLATQGAGVATPKVKKAGLGGKQVAGAAAALCTPQHSKMKSSNSSKKHKLLNSAPR